MKYVIGESTLPFTSPHKRKERKKKIGRRHLRNEEKTWKRKMEESGRAKVVLIRELIKFKMETKLGYMKNVGPHS